METKNIYQKLSEARVALNKCNLKKSGYNPYSKAHYYELADFLPQLNEICLKSRIAPVVSFGNDAATLTLYDMDTEAKLVFVSPMAETQLKNCHPMQNIGASETYVRRYLYQTAFEITEADIADAINYTDRQPVGKDDKKQEPTAPSKYLANNDLVALMRYASQLYGREGARACFVALMDDYKINKKELIPNKPKEIQDYINKWRDVRPPQPAEPDSYPEPTEGEAPWSNMT